MQIIPRRFLIAALVLLATLGPADAQFLEFFSGVYNIFARSYNFLCPVAQPFVELLFNVSLPECGLVDVPDEEGTDEPEGEPAPAPTKKGKVVAGTSAPVPPSTTP